MRYRSSSRLLYRNVLIAAGLAAALGVGAACAEPRAAVGAQPHADGHQPDGSIDASAGSRSKAAEAIAPQPRVDVTRRESRR
jgi:hypothetical protein